MTGTTPGALPARGAAVMCDLAELGEGARKLAAPDIAPRDFLLALIREGQHADAVRYLAHLLPRREAVWWAWVCARRASGPNPPPPIKAAIEASERWIAQPNEDNRRAAMRAAEKAQFGTPAGSTALAAFLSGGSLAPPEAPVVPPGEFMTAKAVAVAIMLATVVSEPEKAEEKYQAFLAQGQELAQRIKLWERIGKE